MHHPRPAHLGLVLLLLAGGCEPAAPSDTAISDTAIRSDSAGVELVEYSRLPPTEAPMIWKNSRSGPASDPEGRPVSILSASVPEVPVTADVLEAQIELMVGDAPPGATDEYSEVLRRVLPARHAPFLPAIRAVFVDADERIWVERFDVPGSGPSRWEVFARDGTWVGRVEMPEGLARGTFPQSAPGFSVASGRLAGAWTDPETGVETVRVYRVIEPGS